MVKHMLIISLEYFTIRGYGVQPDYEKAAEYLKNSSILWYPGCTITAIRLCMNGSVYIILYGCEEARVNINEEFVGMLNKSEHLSETSILQEA